MLVGEQKVNDPVDPYGSLSVLTLRRIHFTDRILHRIKEI